MASTAEDLGEPEPKSPQNTDRDQDLGDDVERGIVTDDEKPTIQKQRTELDETVAWYHENPDYPVHLKLWLDSRPLFCKLMSDSYLENNVLCRRRLGQLLKDGRC